MSLVAHLVPFFGVGAHFCAALGQRPGFRGFDQLTPETQAPLGSRDVPAFDVAHRTRAAAFGPVPQRHLDEAGQLAAWLCGDQDRVALWVVQDLSLLLDELLGRVVGLEQLAER